MGFVFLIIIFLKVTFAENISMFLGLNSDNGKLYFLTDFHSLEIKVWSFLILPQTWTMGIEIFFYILAPFVVRQKVIYVVYLICIFLLLRLYIYYYLGLMSDPWTYRFFPTELTLLLFGSLSYKIFEEMKNKDSVDKTKAYIIISIFGIGILLYQFIKIDELYKNWVIYFLAIYAITYIFYLTKSISFDRYIGELSYPIYLSHFTIIGIIHSVYHGQYAVQVSFFIIIIFSLMLVKFVEELLNVFRQKRVVKNKMRIYDQ